MNYEQKYKEALERANIIYTGKYKPEIAAWTKKSLEAIFPELSESEDEKMAREIIEAIITQVEEEFPRKYQWIDWLEKQAPKIKWSKEDEKMYQSIIDDTIQENQLDGKQLEWLKSLKQRIKEGQQ